MHQLSGLYRDWTHRFGYNGSEYSLNSLIIPNLEKSAKLCKVIKRDL